MTDKPMTIDHLARDFHAYSFEVSAHFSRGDCDMIAATLDAAIRERDHLRGNNRWLTELLDDREAALAALRKRIGRFGASLPVGWWGGRLHAEWDADKESIFTREVEGKRVRLLVEDDDV